MNRDANQEKTINDIDEATMELISKLKAISNTGFIKCLEEYITNFEFIEWLRKSAPGKFIKNSKNSLLLKCLF